MICSTSSFDSAATKSFSVILGFFGIMISLCSFGASASTEAEGFSGIFSSSGGATYLSTAFFYLSKNPAGGPAGFLLGAGGLKESFSASKFSITFLKSSTSFHSSTAGVASFFAFLALSFLLKSKSVFSYFDDASLIF